MIKPAKFAITIEQQDVDFTSRCSIAILIRNILNVAGLDAESKGFGVDQLNEDNYTWVLSRFALEMKYLPRVFDKIEVTTWISDYSRLITTRNFVVSTPSGEIIGGAVSQWCMIDIHQRKAIDLSQLHTDYSDYVLSDIPSPIARPRKILALEPTASHTHKAQYSDIDFNRHVNAIRYIDLMLNMIDVERLKLEQPLRVDLQYIHECYYGDMLSVDYEQRDDSALFEVRRNDDVSAVKCSICWDNVGNVVKNGW